MYSKKLILIIILIANCVLQTHTYATEPDILRNTDGIYSLIMYAGGGFSYYVNSNGIPESVPVDRTRSGFCGTLRVMWHPDHLLRFGLETGKVPFYSYKISDVNNPGDLSLSAVPLLIDWSMPVTRRINLIAGYGIYLMTSKLNYYGETISKTNSLGYMFAANYIQPVAPGVGIAGEIKWLNANETKNDVLNFEVMMVWRFFNW